mmetsp:Transcript_17122/g.48225  ORF Transcript_17122/g.48225 Transcript_17122/m.48225 type:complete len:92 (-) Transcript_17122:177-452(-)
MENLERENKSLREENSAIRRIAQRNKVREFWRGSAGQDRGGKGVAFFRGSNSSQQRRVVSMQIPRNPYNRIASFGESDGSSDMSSTEMLTS